MNFLNPERTPVDYIELSGFKSPGYCEIIGLAREDRLQIMEGRMYSDSVVAWTGYRPIEFGVKIHLYNIETYNDYQTGDFKKLLYKKGQGNKVSPYDITHPFINDPIYNIHSVWIKAVKGPERDGETGAWTVDITFVSGTKAKLTKAASDTPAATQPDALEQENLRKESRNDAAGARLATLKSQQTPAPK